MVNRRRIVARSLSADLNFRELMFSFVISGDDRGAAAGTTDEKLLFSVYPIRTSNTHFSRFLILLRLVESISYGFSIGSGNSNPSLSAIDLPRIRECG